MLKIVLQITFSPFFYVAMISKKPKQIWKHI